MRELHHADKSAYHRLGYVSLHIKRETRDRLNMTRVLMAAESGKSLSQDDVLNALLDTAPIKQPRNAD